MFVLRIEKKGKKYVFFYLYNLSKRRYPLLLCTRTQRQNINAEKAVSVLITNVVQQQ